jgi:phage terminase large subunit-like protein
MSARSSAQSSLAEQLRSLPDGEREHFLAGLSDEEALTLFYDWEVWARPEQLIPPGPWQVWLIMAGRGFGKTRCGAETVREWVKTHRYVNLIGATADDARDIMVEGESGILAICPPDERPQYRPSKRRLEWPNGAISLIFTADEPERLRGKQHEKLWCDEVASWKYEESWDQAMFGLRLGNNPQAIATTTPKPTKLMRGLVKESTTHVTRGSTYDNEQNLAGTFLSKIITKYEGTRLGRQELNAELLEDNPGALWNRDNIDETRIQKMPDLLRVVVGVDPAASSNEDSDETGIVICGRDKQQPPHFYVIDDLSTVASPDGWAASAVRGYGLHKADRIIGEVNNGGEMVEAVIRHKDANVSYKAVHASRGKAIRAEPISALYEQKRVHHVGFFAQLEDQLCDWNPQTDTDSPDRLDALVWALTELSEYSTQLGLLDFYRQTQEEIMAKRNGTSAELLSRAKKREEGFHPEAEIAEVPAQVEPTTEVVKVDLAPNTLRCPQCESTFIQKIGTGRRCGNCGHQFKVDGMGRVTDDKPFVSDGQVRK